MGFIRNNNVWKINKILAGISGGVKPEDVQDMIDTSITPIETEIEGKQDTLTAGDNITISSENVISATVPAPVTYTGGSGIEIKSDNSINLKDWIIHDTTNNWRTTFITNNKLNQDVLLVCNEGFYFYLPKDLVITQYAINFSKGDKYYTISLSIMFTDVTYTGNGTGVITYMNEISDEIYDYVYNSKNMGLERWNTFNMGASANKIMFTILKRV